MGPNALKQSGLLIDACPKRERLNFSEFDQRRLTTVTAQNRDRVTVDCPLGMHMHHMHL